MNIYLQLRQENIYPQKRKLATKEKHSPVYPSGDSRTAITPLNPTSLSHGNETCSEKNGS